MFKIRLAVSSWLWWLSDKIDPEHYITDKMIMDALEESRKPMTEEQEEYLRQAGEAFKKVKRLP